MLGRAQQHYMNPAELKARDERKDTLVLLVGAVAVFGFFAVSLQLPLLAVLTILLFAAAIVKAMRPV